MSSDVRNSSPYGRTLKQYSVDEKLAIIGHAKSHGNRAAGREFNVAESSIREWRKNETKLINSRNSGGTSGNSTSGNNNNNIQNKREISAKLNSQIRRPQEDILRSPIFYAQIAHQLSLFDMNSLLQLHPSPMVGCTAPPLAPPSTKLAPSSLSTTPSSSASTPPPPISPPAGSGRRKLKCPQKIVQ